MRFTPFAFSGTQLGQYVSATGGITGTYTSGSVNYKYHKFTGNGTFSVATGGSMEILIVGGGATGARTGGGGGGVLYLSQRIYKGTYQVTVGNGGVSGSVVAGTSALSASGYLYQALGGDNTGSSGQPTNYIAGANTECGGSDLPGGGGGGASQSGSNATCVPQATGGNGGQGLTYDLDGTATVYGSGGGGRGRATPGGFASGGTGGTNAGNGGSFVAFATSGVANTGGGGGGSYTGPVGFGGSGVVIIRYQTQ